jgi:hypothetical protein
VDEVLHIVSSQRSTVMSRLEELTARVMAIGLLAGAESSSTPAYPAGNRIPARPCLSVAWRPTGGCSAWPPRCG